MPLAALAAGPALVGLAALLALVLSGSASATCLNGTHDVDDSYASSNAFACQFKTVQEALAVAASGERVFIHDGSYDVSLKVTTPGLALEGESEAGVFLIGTNNGEPALALTVSDLSLRRVTILANSSVYALQTWGFALRNLVENVTIRGPALYWAIGLLGSYHTFRNITILDSSNGVDIQAANLTMDNLLFSQTLYAGSNGIGFLGGRDNALSNITIRGPGGDYSAGFYVVDATNISLSDIHIENTAHPLVLRDTAAVRVSGLFARNGTSLLAAYSLSSYATLSADGIDARNFTTGANWNEGGALQLSNSTFQDLRQNGIVAGQAYLVGLSNVTFNNVSQYAVLCTAACAGLNWTGGGVNAAQFALWVNGSASSVILQNTALTNISSWAMWIPAYFTGARVENNTIRDCGNGIAESADVNARFNNNRFFNIPGTGIFARFGSSQIISNLFDNVTAPLDIVDDTFDPDAWFFTNDVPTTNVIDGKPVYFLYQSAGLTIPSNASQVFVLNSRDIIVDGLSQTKAAYGVYVMHSQRVTVSNSSLAGAHAAIVARHTSSLALFNLTGTGPAPPVFAVIVNVTDSSIRLVYAARTGAPSGTALDITSCRNLTLADSVWINWAYGLYMSNCVGASISNLTAGSVFFSLSTGVSAASLVLNDSGGTDPGTARLTVAACVAFDLRDSFLESSSSTAVTVDASSPGRITNVTAVGRGVRALYLANSGNWTVENSTFSRTGSGAAVHIFNSSDFRAENNSFSSGSSALLLDSGAFNASVVHNNFFGSRPSDAYGLGRFDDGYPAGGNYYATAVFAFVDEFVGPGQNITRGHDGIKDAPAFPIPGGISVDRYALMDPWPPRISLTSPANGSLLRAGTTLNFTISNFFDNVTYADSAGGNGSLVYPHDLSTASWTDGWHNLTLITDDPVAPVVIATFAFEFDSSAPSITASPAVGSPVIARATVVTISITDAHFGSGSYRLNGNLSTGAPPYYLNTSRWAPGNYTLAIIAVDILNNSASVSWTFFLDGADPTLSLFDPVGVLFVLPGRNLTFDVADEHLLSSVSFAAIPLNGTPSAYTGSPAVNGTRYSVGTAGWVDGCYGLSVSAIDAAGHNTTGAWTFCVDGKPPDLSSFGNRSANEDTEVFFDGSGAVDLDWDLTFEWSLSASIPFPAVTLHGPLASYSFATPATYDVELAATDRAGNVARALFTFEIFDTTPPAARFFLHDSWDEDVPLELDASNSTDNDGYWNGGATGTFSWRLLPALSGGDPAGLRPTVTFPDPGVVLVELTVRDRSGNVASLSKSVRILDKTPPTIQVSGVRTYNEGERVLLDASGTADNDPSAALEFRWAFDYGGVPQSLVSAQFDFIFAIPGSYAIALTVGDPSGNPSTSSYALRVNDIPSFSNNPVQSVVAVRALFSWPITIADNDTSDTITLTLVQGPEGMSLVGGLLGWTPGDADYGVFRVELRASDGIASADYAFVLHVTWTKPAGNLAPYFTSIPGKTPAPGLPYEYTVSAADVDAEDVVTVALLSGPPGMTLIGNVLRWTVPLGATGAESFEVVLAASDGVATVYQNFSLRTRAGDAAPQFDLIALPDAFDVERGASLSFPITSAWVNDTDDSFADLIFFAVSSDPSAVLVRVERDPFGQPVLVVTGLTAGNATVTLWVLDPSGNSHSADIGANVQSVTVAQATEFPIIPLAVAAAGLLGAGLVLARRRRGVSEAPVESPAVAPPPGPVPDIVVARTLTYVVEGVFVIYEDGRLIHTSFAAGSPEMENAGLVSSMLTAVRQFIKDSFSQEGELSKMGYGDNTILFEKGNHIFMAVIVFGEPEKEMQEAVQAAVERMEYAYAGILEQWDGNVSRFSGFEQFVAPLFDLTSGWARADVVSARTRKDVKILSQIEFFQGFVRLKVGVKNDTDAVITRAALDVQFNEDILRLVRIEPQTYKTTGPRVTLGNIETGEKSSVAYYFDPQICTETNIDGILTYRDAKATIRTLTMKTRKAEVVCPLFFTKEHASTAALKRLVEGELPDRDAKVYQLESLPPGKGVDSVFELCKEVVLAHDVQLVREFVHDRPFSGEAWFYGETRVKGHKVVIRAAVYETDGTVEFFVASSSIRSVTGLLAEFNHTLQQLVAARSPGLGLRPVMDDALKGEISGRAQIGRLAEAEAVADESDQS